MANNLKFKIENSKLGTNKPENKGTPTDNSIIPEAVAQRPKLFIRLGILVLVIIFLLSPFLVVGAMFKQAGVRGYAKTIKSFLFSKESGIKSEEGRVNILILGIGGKGHEGADLTDTMIFASLSLVNHSITLVSIPRDIWIPEIRAKINSAYHWGNLQPERSGALNFAKEIASKVTGQTINYALVIDFSGFQDIIDTIGGISVKVDKSFADNRYPIAGRENDTCGGDASFACRYKTINFEEGVTHMNGETALEFARSREGDNGENTDFARSARQQKIISAVSTRVLSFRTIINPIKDYKILLAVKASVETDFDPEAIGVLAKNVFESRNNINSKIIPMELLISPPISPAYDKQYVLIPKIGSGKWGEINKWFLDTLP